MWKNKLFGERIKDLQGNTHWENELENLGKLTVVFEARRTKSFQRFFP